MVPVELEVHAVKAEVAEVALKKYALGGADLFVLVQKLVTLVLVAAAAAVLAAAAAAVLAVKVVVHPMPYLFITMVQYLPLQTAS